MAGCHRFSTKSRRTGINAFSLFSMSFYSRRHDAINFRLSELLIYYTTRNNWQKFQSKNLSRKSVVCPVIDVVSDETFEYLTGSEGTYGGFDSRLVFDWIPVPERENQRRNFASSAPLRFVSVRIWPFISHIPIFSKSLLQVPF